MNIDHAKDGAARWTAVDEYLEGLYAGTDDVGVTRGWGTR